MKEGRKEEEGQIVHSGHLLTPSSVLPKADVSNVFQFQESSSLLSLFFLAHLFEPVVSIDNQISYGEHHLKTTSEVSKSK